MIESTRRRVARAVVLATLAAIVLAMTWRPVGVRAGCNIIPPASQSFPSTLGSVASPFAVPVDVPDAQVELHLSECDVLPGNTMATFGPTDTVTVRFLRAGPGQPPDGSFI